MGELETATAIRPPMRPRIAFIDLDGTLLNSDLAISDRNREAILRASLAGVWIVLASGRPTASVCRFASLLPGNQYLISSNGGSVVENPSMRVLKQQVMPSEAVAHVLEVAALHGVSACLYDPVSWFVKKIDAFVEIEIVRSGTRPRILTTEELLLPRIKILLIGERLALARCEDALAVSASNQLEWFYTYPEYLEVMPYGVSKGQACQALMAHLNTDPSDAIAIGDGENDRAMLELVSHRVAVANAAPKLRDSANWIAPTNDADGVAVALSALVFRDESALAQMRRN